MRRRWRWWLLGIVAFLPATAVADPPTSTSTSATAAPSGSVKPPPPLALSSIQVPTAVSKRPSLDEWKQGRAVTLDNDGGVCDSLLVREWLRVRCKGIGSSGSVVSGSSQDVFFYVGAPVHPRFATLEAEGAITEVVMPLRPGMSRIVQLTTRATGGYEGPMTQGLWLMLAQSWRKGDKAPTVRTTEQAFNQHDVFGMKIGTADEAKAMGLKFRGGGEVVLSIDPKSPAKQSGAKPGDAVTDVLEELPWPKRLALGDGPVFKMMMVTHDGTTKNVYFARRQGAKW